jgi:hypothetical protein
MIPRPLRINAMLSPHSNAITSQLSPHALQSRLLTLLANGLLPGVKLSAPNLIMRPNVENSLFVFITPLGLQRVDSLLLYVKRIVIAA